MPRAPLLVNGMLVVLLNSGYLTKLVESTAGIFVHSPPPQPLLELNVKRKSHHLTVKVRHSHLTTGKNGSHIVKSNTFTVPGFLFSTLCGLIVYHYSLHYLVRCVVYLHTTVTCDYILVYQFTHIVY